MFELTYASIGRKNLNAKDINSILITARDFNAQKNITGCLLYYDNEFIQLLEGERETILDLYDRIYADQRHYNVTLLTTGDKEKRLFSNWSMAFQKFNKTDVENLKREVELTESIMRFSRIAENPVLASRFLTCCFGSKSDQINEGNLLIDPQRGL